MTVQIYMYCIYAEDIPSAVEFYANVLGLHQDTQIEGSPHFQVGESYLVIQKGHPPAHTPAAHLPVLALSVEDMDLVIERLEQNNISLVSGIEEHEDSRWIKFFDPAGNLIEVIEFYPTLMFGP